MEQSLLESTLEEVVETRDVQEFPSGVYRVPSYRPTPWAIVNQLLTIVDQVTRGRAGLCQRFFSFAFIGGLASLVNLAVFAIVMYGIHLHTSEWIHNIVAFAAASELSIIANFIPNDYFTFRGLNGRARPWGVRCARFHVTAISGTLLTFLIQFGFRFIGHVPAILGQAAALVIVLFYNFSFHHLFTYRHIKTASSR